MSVSVAG
ncbi:Protein of unknown function [Propionibacterium freudenreichii]|nr:Hypothetical protein PFREUD_16630 [Propionibacterium freudenreichii subsp. shermanii CIRM-BIA1]CEG97125.1 Protein of unknown function [Propionibacterium freudenreichii]